MRSLSRVGSLSCPKQNRSASVDATDYTNRQWPLPRRRDKQTRWSKDITTTTPIPPVFFNAIHHQYIPRTSEIITIQTRKVTVPPAPVMTTFKPDKTELDKRQEQDSPAKKTSASGASAGNMKAGSSQRQRSSQQARPFAPVVWKRSSPPPVLKNLQKLPLPPPEWLLPDLQNHQARDKPTDLVETMEQ